MADPSVRKITPSDFDAVLDVLVRAFDDDPWFSFVATQDQRRVERLRSWLRRNLVKRTYPHGETYVTSDGRGVALWNPPTSVRSDGPLAELELWRALLHTAGPRRAGEVRRAIRLLNRHPISVPHVELRILAVDPPSQGQGIATRLMQPTLERCDAAGQGVALMCTNERNVGLYRHFGFEVTETTTIPDGPTLCAMWREPRASLR